MPRPRRTNRANDSALNKENSKNSYMSMGMRSDDRNIKLEMWKAEVRDRMKDAQLKLESMTKGKLSRFELEFRNSLMALAENVLDQVIDINADGFRCFILNEEHDKTPEKNKEFATPQPTTVRRRSRSVTSSRYNTRAQMVRSTSVDVYKTPKGRVRLSSIMSHKKYTVSKPRKIENTGVHVRRIMKPDEEAISTCGSPLYVAPSTVGGPHANIPLPGGVILNIEPKQAKGPLEIPHLDPKTKSQIKLLCEQLKKLV